MKTNGLFLCILASLMVGAVVGEAFTTTLYPTASNFVLSTNKTCGQCTRLLASSTNGASLIKWDLSGLPSDASITSATIVLQIAAAGSGFPTVNVYAAAGAWTESSVLAGDALTGGSALNGDVTWEMQTFPTTAWASGEEGGKDSTLLFQTATTTNAPADANFNGGTANAATLALAQSWKTTPATNFGISVHINSGDTGSVIFGSRHNGEVALRPTLVLAYNSDLGSPPPPVIPQSYANPYVGGAHTGTGLRVPSRYSANNTSGAVIGGVIGGIAALMIIVAVATIILRS